MRTYECDGIRVEIGAQLIQIVYMGKSIIPVEKTPGGPIPAAKRIIKEVWANNYFRKRTKTQIGIKVAEIASKFISGAAIYQLVKKQIEPYAPQIADCAKYIYNHVDWGSLALHVDIGFAIGVAITYFMFGRRKTKRG